jgi:hypothetical protein
VSFIAEKVSDVDIEKYGLREINKREWKADCEYEWVVDRERDIYLRFISRGDRDEPYRTDFNLHWKGHVLWIRLEKHAEGKRGGKGSTIWEFWGWQLPNILMTEKEEIINALKEALVAYKDNGTYSCIADHATYFKNF